MSSNNGDNNELTEFFRAKKAAASNAANAVDWGKRRDEWLAALALLFAQIKNEFMAGQSVQMEERDWPMREDHVGAYNAKQLILTAADQHVEFTPRGTIIVGASGRVDVRGDQGLAVLVWNRPDNRWSVVGQRVPTVRLEPLDANAFLDILKAVMR